MSWKCPKCNAAHPFSVRKCPCGDVSSSRKKTSPPTRTGEDQKRETVDLELADENQDIPESRKQTENLEVRTIPKGLRSGLNTLDEPRQEAATGEIAGANKQKAYLEKQAEIRELWARLKTLEKGHEEKRERVDQEPKAFHPEQISEGLVQEHQHKSEEQADRKGVPVFATPCDNEKVRAETPRIPLKKAGSRRNIFIVLACVICLAAGLYFTLPVIKPSVLQLLK